ncbi:MAG: extracellular solute-binding protein [Clostridia bacterium]|nr:extracellular solute-binding protein [Clostridia bacterium]
MKKRLALVLAGVLTVSALAGCGGKTTEKGNVEVGEAKYGTTYPIETDETLTMWANYTLDPKYKKFEEQPLAKELEKRTGIKVEYTIPTGDAKEQFNLMVASGDYPDIIAYDWYNCMGSPTRAIEENIIIPLNDIIDAYAPNVKKILDSREDKKNFMSDNGDIYGFPSFTEHPAQMMYTGPIIRADYLEKFGLEIPQSLEEWDNVLRTFKANGVENPLTFVGKTLASDKTETFVFGAFNTAYRYYVNDEGKMTYGPIEPEFKQAIEFLHTWYKDGILDPEFASVDDDIVQKKITDGRAGVCIQYVSRIAKWNGAATNGAKFEGAPYPSHKSGEKAEFGQLGSGGTGKYGAITTACDDVELAAKFLDYGYTEDGIKLFNYGIEGETYNIKDGVACFTDEYLNDFDQLNPFTSLHLTFHEVNRFNQRNMMPEQQEALVRWETNMAKHLVPAITPTSEESDATLSKENNIKTYVEEKVLKYITGYESMDSYDEFVAEIKNMGIDEVLKIKQAQLERFNNR